MFQQSKMIMSIAAFVGRDSIRLIIRMHTARRMNTTGYVSGAMRILKNNFNGRQILTRIKEIQGILMDGEKMMKPGAKRILNVILYTMIGITGVLAIIWHFLSVAATLKLAINGADMTTWIKDPYIECLEWLIVSTCLFGIYSLFSLLVLRKKKRNSLCWCNCSFSIYCRLRHVCVLCYLYKFSVCKHSVRDV